MQVLKQVARQCDLNQPEQVKKWLSECKWSNKTKVKFCDGYSAYLKFMQIQWTLPNYLVAERFPFIPTEEEIGQLIAGCGKQTATVLQTLKETGIRIGERVQLKWIDSQRKTLSITPEKGSNPRILSISEKLIGIINSLPKKRETIFQPKKRMLREYFSLQRKRTAEKLQNPRLKQITFHTLRHWRGTMWYFELRDLREVQKLLGHKSILTTQIYENLACALFLNDSNRDKYISKVAHNEAEELALMDAGFEYVSERGELHFYRKRKL